VRRLTIAVVMVAVLALPAFAVGLGQVLYKGSRVSVLLKNEKKVKTVAVDPGLTLHCNEGTTTEDLPIATTAAERPKLKQGKFHTVTSIPLVFEVIGDDGYLVSKSHGDLVLTVRGKFNDRLSRASGTLTFRGDYSGPKSANGYYNEHYHGCDSGTVNWTVHN
jgi:hypothetical protein